MKNNNYSWIFDSRDNNQISQDDFARFVKSASRLQRCTDNVENHNAFMKKVCILILCVTAVILMFACVKGLIDDNSQLGAYAGMSHDEKVNLLNERVNESLVEVSVASNIVFPNGSEDTGIARFVNESNNQLSQKFILYIKGDSDPLYESGIVEPGFWIEEITLNRYLDPDQYDAVVEIITFNQESQTVVGQLETEVKMTIY